MYKDENQRDDRDVRLDEDDMDLSDMIDEYRQDDELRRKIDEMKRQKEEAKQQSQESKIVDIRADEEEDRHSEENGADADQTLVIMDGKTKESFDEEEAAEKTMVFTKQSDHDEKLNDTIVKPLSEIQEVEDAFDEESADEETEEDEDDHSEGKDKNNTRMYVIIGVIIAILVLILGIGAVKMMTNNAPEDDPVVEKPSTDEEVDEEIDEVNVDNDNLNDNSARISYLTKQKDAYETQLATVASNIAKWESDRDDAKQMMDTQYAAALNATEDAGNYNTTFVQPALEELNNAKAQLEADPENEELANLVKEKQDLYDAAKATYDEKLAEANRLNTEYNTGDAQTLYKSAKEQLVTLNAQKEELEQKITEIENELASYNE